MRWRWYGEHALITEGDDQEIIKLARAIRVAKIPGVEQVTSAYQTLLVQVSDPGFDPAFLDIKPGDLEIGKLVEIPVCYELGEDLAAAADELGVGESELINRHGQILSCFAIGFCPGFPYLGYLPQEISGLARHATPRKRVAPGSVAIVGNQSGIYTMERPGGWWLIGRTPLCLVDVDNEYFPLSAGDRVRFYPITRSDYDDQLRRSPQGG